MLNVANLERSRRFYEDALGFTVGQVAAGEALLHLGEQEVALVEQPGGLPYPAPRAANDPWFQHFAVAVSDMDAAYRRLSDYGHEPISRGGPQQLPPSTGSVIAYKFRDPDGHPLELSYIPNSAWTAKPSPHAGPFLGIDHTGIAVADLDESITFYTSLGFRLEAQGFNTGPEQDRLDGLDAVQLDIAVLKGGLGPHIELLHYRAPKPSAAPLRFSEHDIPSTKIVIDQGGRQNAPSAEQIDRLGSRHDGMGMIVGQ